MVIAARQEGIAVGMLMDVVLGVPRVVYPGNPLDQAVEARTTVALGDGDIGCEVASMGVQVHGGMGFVEETGAAQHYRDARIALQYDGAAHRTPEQQARDARREAYCLERDWLPLRCTQEDLREGFTRVIGVVRRRLASRGAFGATSRG